MFYYSNNRQKEKKF